MAWHSAQWNTVPRSGLAVGNRWVGNSDLSGCCDCSKDCEEKIELFVETF